uniref:NR LBD domain-containing protein n=1 Tax=Hydatigena taeniaeformis TaxID=6205 RepID=A0A0R3WYH9_HYDTA
LDLIVAFSNPCLGPPWCPDWHDLEPLLLRLWGEEAVAESTPGWTSSPSLSCLQRMMRISTMAVEERRLSPIVTGLLTAWHLIHPGMMMRMIM